MIFSRYTITKEWRSLGRHLHFRRRRREIGLGHLQLRTRGGLLGLNFNMSHMRVNRRRGRSCTHRVHRHLLRLYLLLSGLVVLDSRWWSLPRRNIRCNGTVALPKLMTSIRLATYSITSALVVIQLSGHLKYVFQSKLF